MEIFKEPLDISGAAESCTFSQCKMTNGLVDINLEIDSIDHKDILSKTFDAFIRQETIVYRGRRYRVWDHSYLPCSIGKRHLFTLKVVP